MKTQENNIVILLRKIIALAFPDNFEATEDTNRKVILDKIQEYDSDLYSIVNEFLIAFESHHFIISDYQLKLKAADVWQSQLQMFRELLEKRKQSLIVACKEKSINIDYELENLMD
jgi:hypothetical protein